MSFFGRAITFFFALHLSSSAVFAQGTPDGITPAVEEICSGLEGVSFGLCNAYCEAQDCDMHRRPSCEILRGNFQRLTGSEHFPCDIIDEPSCAELGVEEAGPICGGTCPLGRLCISDGATCFCSIAR